MVVEIVGKMGFVMELLDGLDRQNTVQMLEEQKKGSWTVCLLQLHYIIHWYRADILQAVAIKFRRVACTFIAFVPRNMSLLDTMRGPLSYAWTFHLQ